MHSYLLFHSLVEIVSATISFGTFLFAWNTRRFQNGYLLTVGAAALFVGFFEVLHSLAFPGMPIFSGYDENLAPQLWLSARLFQAAAALAGLLLVRRAVRAPWLLAGFGAACAALCGAVFLRQLPELVLKPAGLTGFKVAAEWTLAGAFLGTVPLLLRVRERFSPRVLRLLVAHGITMAACEICFTLYSRPDDFRNFLGHLLLLGGGSLQYLAILRAGLIDPDETHFRDLTQVRDRLQRAQTAGSIGTFEWDLARGSVTIAGMESVYGGEPDALPHDVDAWRSRLHPEDRERVDRLIADVIAGRAEYDTEYRVAWRDGSVHWVAARGRLHRDERGRAVALVGVNMEITERKRAEQALRDADRSKNEFLAMLSHELRNPLAPIRNSLYLLDRVEPGGDQARRARTILGRQTDQLARLVDDLLDVTRISRHKMRLQRQRLELNELLRRVVEDQRSLFDVAGLRLESVPFSRPLFVNADSSRLAQVVGNLLQNAVKFTPRGGRVTVATAVKGGQVELHVADTGTGMSREVLARLFQPFVQADATLDRSRAGLGLGLALVRGLVELHEGEVRAHSDGPGKGALFVVSLPLEIGDEERPRASVAASAPPPRRVLVIDDNADAADSLRDLLELSGHEVAVAYDGFTGIDKARELRPDVVLCDLGLPGLDGYDVARAMRADPVLAETRLVALSGHAFPEDLQRSAEAGFEQHLTKPPRIEKLAELLGSAGAGR